MYHRKMIYESVKPVEYTTITNKKSKKNWRFFTYWWWSMKKRDWIYDGLALSHCEISKICCFLFEDLRKVFWVILVADFSVYE